MPSFIFPFYPVSLLTTEPQGALFLTQVPRFANLFYFHLLPFSDKELMRWKDDFLPSSPLIFIRHSEGKLFGERCWDNFYTSLRKIMHLSGIVPKRRNPSFKTVCGTQTSLEGPGLLFLQGRQEMVTPCFICNPHFCHLQGWTTFTRSHPKASMSFEWTFRTTGSQPMPSMINSVWPMPEVSIGWRWRDTVAQQVQKNSQNHRK